MKRWSLQQTRQCKTCPWRVDTSVDDIPNYDPEQHEYLQDRIAPPGQLIQTSGLKVMACHYSDDDNRYHCIGWVYHQLGPGNNIALRLRMMSCDNADQIEVIGPQCESFEDTFN